MQLTSRRVGWCRSFFVQVQDINTSHYRICFSPKVISQCVPRSQEAARLIGKKVLCWSCKSAMSTLLNQPWPSHISRVLKCDSSCIKMLIFEDATFEQNFAPVDDGILLYPVFWLWGTDSAANWWRNWIAEATLEPSRFRWNFKEVFQATLGQRFFTSATRSPWMIKLDIRCLFPCTHGSFFWKYENALYLILVWRCTALELGITKRSELVGETAWMLLWHRLWPSFGKPCLCSWPTGAGLFFSVKWKLARNLVESYQSAKRRFLADDLQMKLKSGQPLFHMIAVLLAYSGLREDLHTIYVFFLSYNW